MSYRILSGRGFTLVEIMAVVVIIGLLATLSLPTIRRARNSAVEKTLFNDARQISAAANQYFLEKSKTNVSLGGLVGDGSYLAALSAGTLIAQGPGNVTAAELNPAANLWNTANGLNTVLASSNDNTSANTVYRLGNSGYDTSFSTNPQVTGAALGGYNASTTAATKDVGLVFAVETGALLKKSATSSSATAAYSY